MGPRMKFAMGAGGVGATADWKSFRHMARTWLGGSRKDSKVLPNSIGIVSANDAERKRYSFAAGFEENQLHMMHEGKDFSRVTEMG